MPLQTQTERERERERKREREREREGNLTTCVFFGYLGRGGAQKEVRL